MKLYDCCMYFDEDLMLDLRLNTLHKYVDKFIIVESSYTHSGKKRDLLFNEKNFSKFKDKISYIALNEEPPDLYDINEEDIIYQLEEEIYQFFDDKNNLKKKDKKINQKLETLSRNFIYKHTGKKPLTNINIIHI